MEQKHQILIVDDAELNRSMLADMLAEEYCVIEADNGGEALAVLAARHDEIALVLLDVMMPVMNGFEVLSVMGESESLRGIPVVMISAETGASYIDRAYDLGAIDYISRPFDEKTVRRRVKNTIMLYQKQRMLEDMVAAQAVGLADAYEALTDGRGPALSHEAALRKLREGACGVFPQLLLRCLSEVGPQLQTTAAGQAADTERSGLSARSGRGKASDRTLALLEQERTKYRFFASMSREILCEYSVETDLLTLSDWGAAQLGLSELIAHPGQSAALQAVLRREDLLDLYRRLQEAVPAEPLVHAAYPLCIRGEARWHKVVARPLWLGEEHNELAGMIGKLSDVHEERLQLEALKKRAEQDSLTKLRNHMSVREAIEQILARGDAKKHALVLFDLDWFKSANDRYGHMFGDAVLKHVAQRIVENIRGEDVAARIGGDEFLIFAACPDEEERLAARLFGAVRGTYEGFSISLSMGVALCPQDGMRYEELFHKADQALYAAKKRGRSRFCFYDASVTGTLSVLSPAESEM